MSGSLRWLDPAEAQAWFDRLPAALRLRTLSPDFVQADATRAPGLQPVAVGYAEGEARWLHALHLRPLPGFGQVALSAYGYGGPLATSADPGFAARAWAAWQQAAAQREVVGEFCRFHPEVDHARWFGGEVRPNRPTVGVDLLQQPLEAQYSTLARRKLRRTAGLPVRWSRDAGDWRRWGGFYRDAMAALGAQERYLFGDAYFAALAALPGVDLCIVGTGDDWLSAGVYLAQQGAPAGQGVLEYHLGASSAQGHAAGSATLLQHAAGLQGQRLGLAHLYLGGGTTPDGDNPLLFYKRSFSRRERTFLVGNAIHHRPLFDAYARARGLEPAQAPASILFD